MMPRITTNPPKPQPQRAPVSFDTRIEAVETWVANLPLVNVGETCRLVFNALTELNTMELPPQQRFKVLELFRRPNRYLRDALKRHFVGASFPLSTKATKAAALLYGVQLETAKGYQRIADELLNVDNLRQDFTLLAAGLHRALYYLGQGLLTTYQVYRPASPDLWRNIHHLYDASERKGLQASAVKEPYRHDRETTIEAQYKQILLLALADPHHLPQADMAQVYVLLEQWAPQCRLYPPHVAEPSNVSIVDLESDAPPCHLVHSAAPRNTTSRLLDTSTLIHTLRGLLPQTPPEILTQRQALRSETPDAQWRILLQRLLTAWGMTSKRGFSRSVGTAENIELIYGISAIHQCLNGSDALVTENKSSFGHHPARRAGKEKQPLHSPAAANEGLPQSGTVLNESAGGACLKWKAANPGKIRVGELLAIRHDQRHSQGWDVAVIRWLKTLSDHTVEFGIQLLAPDAIPIAVRLCNEEEPDHDYLKSLYLPELKATRQPASLIVPAFLYHVNDIVSLKMEHRELRLRLVKALESNRVYSRFQFAPLI